MGIFTFFESPKFNMLIPKILVYLRTLLKNFYKLK